MNQKSETEPSKVPHVSLLWLDNANLTRCRVLPLRRFRQPNFRLELTNAVQSMPSMYDSPFESPVGVVHWTPDHELSSTTGQTKPQAKLHDISSWMAGTRACFGEMTKDGAVWEQCPRTFLRLQGQKLLSQFNIQATIGFELEFQLLDPKLSPTGGAELAPVDSTLYCEVRALQLGSSWQVLSEIVQTLEQDLGIKVYQYHPESAGGQFEISIGYEKSNHGSDVLSPVDAVDQLVLARQTVYGIAARHGLQATFVPKLRSNDTGSGAHIHLGLLDSLVSVDELTKNLFQTKTALASAFVAGILDELPGLMMLLAPTINSYERLQPHCWAGAYACYGFENREAAIRLIGSNRANDLSQADHFEIKTVDATANPYVAVGALLAAGMAGIQRNSTLPEPMIVDPDSLTETERPKRLPQSLSAAIEAFQLRRAAFWDQVLSKQYAELLVRIRTAEEEYYGKLTRDDMIQQLVRRY